MYVVHHNTLSDSFLIRMYDFNPNRVRIEYGYHFSKTGQERIAKKHYPIISGTCQYTTGWSTDPTLRDSYPGLVISEFRSFAFGDYHSDLLLMGTVYRWQLYMYVVPPPGSHATHSSFATLNKLRCSLLHWIKRSLSWKKWSLNAIQFHARKQHRLYCCVVRATAWS